MVAEIFFAWSLSTDQSKLNALLEPLFRVASNSRLFCFE